MMEAKQNIARSPKKFEIEFGQYNNFWFEVLRGFYLIKYNDQSLTSL